MSNPNYDSILSITLANHAETITDNIFTARPLFYFLKEGDRIKMKSGGNKIVEPLVHALNSTAGSYAHYDVLPTTPQEGITAAEYDWKEFAVSIAISGFEEAVNAGEEEVIDLLEAKTMQAEESATEVLDEMFFLDGSGNGGKDWLGLAKLVAQNTASVGGIDPSTNTYWQSYINNTATALTLALLTTGYNTVSVGNDQPKVGLTTQTLYEKYEALLQPNQRFTDMRTGDAGFQNLMFKGAPVCYDTYCQSGSWYWLNTKYLKLVGHKSVWFKPTPFVRPPNQNARYAQLLCMGNLVASNRKRQGVLTNKTA